MTFPGFEIVETRLSDVRTLGITCLRAWDQDSNFRTSVLDGVLGVLKSSDTERNLKRRILAGNGFDPLTSRL
jgi:hypothetical protein